MSTNLPGPVRDEFAVIGSHGPDTLVRFAKSSGGSRLTGVIRVFGLPAL
jgi:hypothetical protein